MDRLGHCVIVVLCVSHEKILKEIIIIIIIIITIIIIICIFAVELELNKHIRKLIKIN